MEGRGRRVFAGAPEKSLLLLKAWGGLPHGRGVRLQAQRPEYDKLRDWITAGAPFGSRDDPKVVSIRVAPAEQQLSMQSEQQLQVRAAALAVIDALYATRGMECRVEQQFCRHVTRQQCGVARPL